MRPFVLDCSVTMAWCFADESDPYSDQVLESLTAGEAFVPAVWPLEVANVLSVGERRQRVTETNAWRFVQLLNRLRIHIDPLSGDLSVERLFALAREFSLSAYDASYLELAARRKLPLATLDKRLLSAAQSVGVRPF